jgi:hypothetical protein
MKTRSTIQMLVPALLLATATIPVAYSQEPLPDNKKRALHRFDPADIFPEERQPARNRRSRKRNEGPAPPSRASAPTSRAPGASENPARLRSLNPIESPTPTRRASGATADPSPAPTREPLTQDSAPLSEATPSTTPTPEATPQIDAMAAVQSPQLPSAVDGDQSDSSLRFPLYLIIPMLCLILAALIALIIGLKKQLRTP